MKNKRGWRIAAGLLALLLLLTVALTVGVLAAEPG